VKNVNCLFGRKPDFPRTGVDIEGLFFSFVSSRVWPGESTSTQLSGASVRKTFSPISARRLPDRKQFVRRFPSAQKISRPLSARCAWESVSSANDDCIYQTICLKMKTLTLPNTTLQITRIIKAPRDRVYATWTDLELAKQWWGPAGCETHELVSDPRVGGTFRWVLSTPDGERMMAQGEFREVRPREKVVYTWQWADDPDWENVESLVTVEFRDHPDGTELRLTHEKLPSEQSRDNHTYGWNSALDKFERLLAR
jgi:uncharacterized protein YndB with AHSA1/START domain